MLRKMESQKRLEHDTEVYFDALSEEAAREENALAESLHSAAEGIDYDLEAVASTVTARRDPRPRL